mmetsp:Transcript_2247/g.5258  ORF Transcript_2247/g.5258 Transcript_2247/m.5258 type:complete len:276 (+) Transcript_2247:346-1173(+)
MLTWAVPIILTWQSRSPGLHRDREGRRVGLRVVGVVACGVHDHHAAVHSPAHGVPALEGAAQVREDADTETPLRPVTHCNPSCFSREAGACHECPARNWQGQRATKSESSGPDSDVHVLWQLLVTRALPAWRGTRHSRLRLAGVLRRLVRRRLGSWVHRVRVWLSWRVALCKQSPTSPEVQEHKRSVNPRLAFDPTGGRCSAGVHVLAVQSPTCDRQSSADVSRCATSVRSDRAINCLVWPWLLTDNDTRTPWGTGSAGAFAHWERGIFSFSGRS